MHSRRLCQKMECDKGRETAIRSKGGPQTGRSANVGGVSHRQQSRSPSAHLRLQQARKSDLNAIFFKMKTHTKY